MGPTAPRPRAKSGKPDKSGPLPRTQQPGASEPFTGCPFGLGEPKAAVIIDVASPLRVPPRLPVTDARPQGPMAFRMPGRAVVPTPSMAPRLVAPKVPAAIDAPGPYPIPSRETKEEGRAESRVEGPLSTIVPHLPPRVPQRAPAI